MRSASTSCSPSPTRRAAQRVIDRLAATTLASTPGFRARWDALRPSLDYDAAFAAALAGKPVVLAYGSTTTEQQSGALPPPAFTQRDLGGHVIPLAQERGYTANLPALTRAAAASGTSTRRSMSTTSCAACRWSSATATATTRRWRSSLAAVAVEAKTIKPVFDENGDLSAFDAGGLVVPVAADGLALVPYRGAQRTFHYESADRHPRRQREVKGIEGAIVLVGTTAKGLQDLRSTPFGPDFPGVELHANLVSGMLDGEMTSVPRGAREVESLMIVLAGLAVVFPIPWRRPFMTTLGVALIAAAVIARQLLVLEARPLGDAVGAHAGDAAGAAGSTTC